MSIIFSTLSYITGLSPNINGFTQNLRRATEKQNLTPEDLAHITKSLDSKIARTALIKGPYNTLYHLANLAKGDPAAQTALTNTLRHAIPNLDSERFVDVVRLSRDHAFLKEAISQESIKAAAIKMRDNGFVDDLAKLKKLLPMGTLDDVLKGYNLLSTDPVKDHPLPRVSIISDNNTATAQIGRKTGTPAALKSLWERTRGHHPDEVSGVHKALDTLVARAKNMHKINPAPPPAEDTSQPTPP